MIITQNRLLRKRNSFEDGTRKRSRICTSPKEPEPKSGAVIKNTTFPREYAACFQFAPINLPTFIELPAQKSVQTGRTQARLS